MPYNTLIQNTFAMSYNATVKLCYINDTETSSNKYFPEIVDKQTITIEAPAQDLNTHQYFELFKSFLRAVGFDEYGIMDAACRVAFNDCNREDDMEKLMGEYELQDKQSYTDDDYEAPNGDYIKNYPLINRVEVITNKGREFVRYGCFNVQVSEQDEGRTLKVFLS